MRRIYALRLFGKWTRIRSRGGSNKTAHVHADFWSDIRVIYADFFLQGFDHVEMRVTKAPIRALLTKVYAARNFFFSLGGTAEKIDTLNASCCASTPVPKLTLYIRWNKCLTYCCPFALFHLIGTWIAFRSCLCLFCHIYIAKLASPCIVWVVLLPRHQLGKSPFCDERGKLFRTRRKGYVQNGGQFRQWLILNTYEVPSAHVVCSQSLYSRVIKGQGKREKHKRGL